MDTNTLHQKRIKITATRARWDSHALVATAITEARTSLQTGNGYETILAHYCFEPFHYQWLKSAGWYESYARLPQLPAVRRLTERQSYALGLAAELYARSQTIDLMRAHAVTDLWTFRRLYSYLKAHGWRYWSLYGRWLHR